ncbi:MAG: RNA polymerase sigma factor [Nannocystaceae bacterium]|nr:RNA polymerase sigma factor [Nannocystaceae bacterium]
MPSPRARLSVVGPEGPADEPLPEDFDGVFRRFSPHVARIALSVLGAADEVDDVVQEVFVIAHRHLDAVRDRGAVRAWLSRVTVREAARKLRRRKLRRILGLGGDVADSPHLADHGVTAEQRAMLLSIYRVLDRLPTAERLAWTLRHVEGERLDAVAELCSCSLATAKRRIAAASARIREVTGAAIDGREDGDG